MKRLAALLLAAMLVLSGCTTPPPSSITPDSQPPAEPSSASKPTMTDSQRERYLHELDTLNQTGSLVVNWNGTPISNDNNFALIWDIIDAVPSDNNLVKLTVEIYGNMYLDPFTLQETLYGTEIPILTEGLPYSPQLALGKSVIELRDNPGGSVEAVSCSYSPYSSPGITYLKEQSAKNPQSADSPKLDTSKYDPTFVNFIWRKLMQRRYIETPADITLADLASMTDPLEIGWDALPQGVDSENYFLDSSLLRLMPNLTGVNCYIYLNDYSVFEGMNNLTELRLSGMNDARMATLRVGHTDSLHLENPDCDVLDLTNVNTDKLTLMSYSTAVRGFAGCDRIKNLYINSTRTDMRLVNSEAFPNAEYLNMMFYSDFERVRDFSQLATFDGKAVIDLMLSYMACNDKTVETLAGVKPRLLVLSPNNGNGNRKPPSEELLSAVCATKTVVSDEYGFFELRTKDSAIE